MTRLQVQTIIIDRVKCNQLLIVTTYTVRAVKSAFTIFSHPIKYMLQTRYSLCSKISDTPCFKCT